jgi:predicted alpha/beta-hydrolase family hydrolase
VADQPPAERWSLLLAPGAGADRDQASLVALDGAATAAGAHVVRMDFPYRKAGRRAPDRAPKLVASVLEEAGAMGGPDPLLLGGRSMGGRMCSMAVGGSPSGAEVAGRPVGGLLLVSYPLHPPGRPDRPRTEHFPALRVPCLFVSGTSDAFATPDELEEASAAIPGPVTHAWIPRKDHGLRGADAAVVDAVRAWLVGLGLDHTGAGA